MRSRIVNGTLYRVLCTLPSDFLNTQYNHIIHHSKYIYKYNIHTCFSSVKYCYSNNVRTWMADVNTSAIGMLVIWWRASQRHRSTDRKMANCVVTQTHDIIVLWSTMSWGGTMHCYWSGTQSLNLQNCLHYLSATRSRSTCYNYCLGHSNLYMCFWSSARLALRLPGPLCYIHVIPAWFFWTSNTLQCMCRSTSRSQLDRMVSFMCTCGLSVADLLLLSICPLTWPLGKVHHQKRTYKLEWPYFTKIYL